MLKEGITMQTIFERSEKKYLLTETQYKDFYKAISKAVEKDAYDDYTIYNLYFDTNHYDLIRNSIEKPPYKEKLRLRSYEIPHEETKVFVELKKKFNHTVFKRRVECSMKEAMALIYKQQPLSNQQQIVNEILYFLSFYHPVPKLFLSYDRRAFHGKDDPSLRITFDSNIQYRTDQLDLRQSCSNISYFKEPTILMEIKSHHAFPLWLTHILSEMQIYPASFSKYGKIYTDCLYPIYTKENQLC